MNMVLLRLIGLFAGLSMLAFGGGKGVIPDAAVDRHHCLSAGEFLDMFAISRAAPGPGSLIVMLIGLKAAGMTGAAVSFAAMFLPSCLAAHVVARYWQRAARFAWRAVLERALAQIAIGLTFASGLALVRSAERGWLPWRVTIISAALFSLIDINPILLLAMGGGAVLLVGAAAV
jgi:chromate transporter